MSWQGLNFDFTGVVFDGGDFSGARFSSGIVLLTSAEFSGGEVDFTQVEFSSGGVYFTQAEFSGGKISFRGAVFSGEVSFEHAERWAYPPTFSWDGKLPIGVSLPAQVSGNPPLG